MYDSVFDESDTKPSSQENANVYSENDLSSESIEIPYTNISPSNSIRRPNVSLLRIVENASPIYNSSLDEDSINIGSELFSDMINNLNDDTTNEICSDDKSQSDNQNQSDNQSQSDLFNDVLFDDNRQESEVSENYSDVVIISPDDQDIVASYDADVVRLRLAVEDVGRNVYNEILRHIDIKPIVTVKYIYISENVVEVLSMMSHRRELITMAKLFRLEFIPSNFSNLIYRTIYDNKHSNPIITAKYYFNSHGFIIGSIKCESSLEIIPSSQNSIQDLSNQDGVNNINDIDTTTSYISNIVSVLITDTVSEVMSSPLAYRNPYYNQSLFSQLTSLQRSRSRTRTLSSELCSSILQSDCSTVVME
ncbi:MAG: hypothetical protein ACRCZI_13345 [Cetobacterium sp.]